MNSNKNNEPKIRRGTNRTKPANRENCVWCDGSNVEFSHEEDYSDVADEEDKIMMIYECFDCCREIAGEVYYE